MQLSWIKTGMFDLTFNLASPWSPLNPKCLDYLHLYVECPWNWKTFNSRDGEREGKKDNERQTDVHKHVLLEGIFSLKGRAEIEKNNCIFPGLSVPGVLCCVWECVCSLMMGTLKVLICVVREAAYIGARVSEVRFSSLQEPFTWGDRRVFGLAECEWVCLGMKQSR